MIDCGYSGDICESKTCCDNILDTINEVIEIDENGEKHLKVIGEIELGEVQIDIDNSDLLDAINEQTSEINNANLSNVNLLMNEIRTLKKAKNKVKKTNYNANAMHVLTDSTKQVIVKVISGSGKVGFSNGIKYDFSESTEKIGLIYESDEATEDKEIEVILDANTEIEIQEFYEAENV